MSTVFKSDKTKRIVLLIAAGLMLIAIILQFSLGGTNERESILNTLNAFGYRVTDEDLYIAGDYQNISIAELLPEAELDSAVQASRHADFPSDVTRRGDVVLVLVALRDQRVITLYFLDGEMELCFIQKPNSTEVEALGDALE